MMAKRHLIGDGLRFLAAGAVNTLVTLLLFQILLFWMPWGLAYSIAFAAGLAFVTLVYPYWVFADGVQSTSRATANAAYYVASYGAAISLLALFTEGLNINPRLSAIVTLALMTPLNFSVSRWLFHRETPLRSSRKTIIDEGGHTDTNDPPRTEHRVLP